MPIQKSCQKSCRISYLVQNHLAQLLMHFIKCWLLATVGPSVQLKRTKFRNFVKAAFLADNEWNFGPSSVTSPLDHMRFNETMARTHSIREKMNRHEYCLGLNLLKRPTIRGLCCKTLPIHYTHSLHSFIIAFIHNYWTISQRIFYQWTDMLTICSWIYRYLDVYWPIGFIQTHHF